MNIFASCKSVVPSRLQPASARERLAVVELDIHALAFCCSHIGFRCGCQAHCRRNGGPVLKDVIPVFRIILRRQVQFVFPTEFDGDVGLLCDFPADFRIRVSGDGNTITAISAIDRSEPEGMVPIIHVHLREINETGRANQVIAHQAIRRPQFEVGDPVFDGRHPLLIGYHPAETCRREEAPSVVLGESLRSIVAEIDFSKITAVEIIGKTSGKAEITVRERVL